MQNYQSLNALQLPFPYRGNEPIIDNSVPEYKKKILRTQRPDLVFGLRQTAKLQSLLAGNPDIVDTPFEKSPSPSFPFLLLEAKPEFGCPGFTSVEEQSAFPLRTLLNIQKNVPTTAEARFEPLVWFMANQGDEWRIYACVPEGPKTVSFRREHYLLPHVLTVSSESLISGMEASFAKIALYKSFSLLT